MNLGSVASRVRAGETVTFKASGNSMSPRVRNGDQVTVTPIRGVPLKGDVVLARVKGRWMLHLVSALKPQHAQISNNKGRVNGWTALSNVVGVLREP